MVSSKSSFYWCVIKWLITPVKDLWLLNFLPDQKCEWMGNSLVISTIFSLNYEELTILAGMSPGYWFNDLIYAAFEITDQKYQLWLYYMRRFIRSGELLIAFVMNISFPRFHIFPRNKAHTHNTTQHTRSHLFAR